MRVAIALAVVAMLASCAIPVRNENNDKPMLVAAVGASVPQADGSVAHNPGLPQPKADSYQPSATFDWMLLLQIGAGLAFGTTGVAVVGKIRTLATAVKDAAAFADDIEKSTSDDQVMTLKAMHARRQAEHGTFTTIAKSRGKA